MLEKPYRILIVDDDEDCLANLSDILTEQGYRTETAVSGSSALGKLQKNCPEEERPFDLCLLDFKMPRMDGVEIKKKILAQIPGLRAIMITAFAGEEGVQRAEEVGAWKVLRKPVDIEVLLGLIDEAVA